MQINVVNCIIDALVSKGSCGVQGLGTFKLKKTSASFEKAKTIITPPKATVEFSEDVDLDHSLEQALMQQYPLSDKKASKAVSTFTNKVVNGLLNFDKVSLTNLGTLERKTDKIEFVPSESLSILLSETLPEIETAPFVAAKKKVQEEKTSIAKEAKPVVTPPVKKEPIVEAPKEVVKPKEAKLNVSAPKAKVETPKAKVVSPPKPIEAKTKAATPEPIKLKQEAKPLTPAKKTETKPAVAKPAQTQVYQEEKESAFSRFLPWILLLLLIGLVTWGISAIIGSVKSDDKTEQVASPEDGEDKESIHPEEAEEGTKEVAQESKANNAESEEQPPRIEKDKNGKVIPTGSDLPSECVIIAGSYLYQNNVDEMVNKIRRLGYEVYKEKYGNHIRVGFTFPCGDVNLKVFIEEVRAKLSKHAWYLVPDLAI